MEHLCMDICDCLPGLSRFVPGCTHHAAICRQGQGIYRNTFLYGVLKAARRKYCTEHDLVFEPVGEIKCARSLYTVGTAGDVCTFLL